MERLPQYVPAEATYPSNRMTKETDLIDRLRDDILELIEESAWQKVCSAIRELGAETVRDCLTMTREARDRGTIKQTPTAYCLWQIKQARQLRQLTAGRQKLVSLLQCSTASAATTSSRHLGS